MRPCIIGDWDRTVVSLRHQERLGFTYAVAVRDLRSRG